MKTIAIASQKGKVGKIAVARNLALFAIKYNLRALCVNLDPQKSFGETLRTLYERTVGGQDDELQSLTGNALFDGEITKLQPLLCGESAVLMTTDRELVDAASRPLEGLHVPRAALAKLARDFDVYIIDTAPTLGNPLYVALIAADFVACPCTVDQDAIDGSGNLFEDIARMQQLEWSADFVTLGLLTNRVNARRVFDHNVLEQLRDKLGEVVMEGVLHDHVATQYARDWPV